MGAGGNRRLVSWGGRRGKAAVKSEVTRFHWRGAVDCRQAGTAPGAGTATWHCRRRRRGGTMPNVKQPAAAFSVPLISLAFSTGRGPAQRRRSPAAPSGSAGRGGAAGAGPTGPASTGARMANNMSHLPPLPQIGHPESYYARLAKQGEREGDIHAHEA